MSDLHILGICGTFMGGLAALAREQGLSVSGSDSGVYPPMSTQLEALQIRLQEGYDPAHLQPAPGEVLIGNALSRGNPSVEAVLNQGLRYRSGPQWLAESVLPGRCTIGVAGTHGKTTTTAIVAFLLDRLGADPGFLIGGVAHDFDRSARLGGGDCFVVEADEYDSAYFDKRSKFVHYRPQIAILNNLEFDHADIFADLAAIERQFHHLARTIPGRGKVIVKAGDEALQRVLAQGCWTPVESFSADPGAGADWQAESEPDGARFALHYQGRSLGQVSWAMRGRHNVANATAAVAAIAAAGHDPVQALQLLADFGGVRRRLEALGSIAGIEVLEDFAHHPTAVAVTIEAAKAGCAGRLIVALEPRSNSMRQGAHRDLLAPALRGADCALVLERADLPWDAAGALAELGERARCVVSVEALLVALDGYCRAGDRVVFMSNGSFDNAPRRFVQQLRRRAD